MDKKKILTKSGSNKSQISKDYVDTVIKKYNTGQAIEHAHRTALETYFEKITDLNAVNDPKRSEYGAPDFVFLKDKIPIAYAEAKDIGVSLDDVEKGEQLERYYGYSNLILTDYLEFRFFRNGVPYCEPIKIAELKSGQVVPIEENFTLAQDTIKDFITEAKEPIKSGVLLAKVMAGKARRIRDNIKTFLKNPDDKGNESLLSIYNVIKKLLLADLDYEKFADMYAQTVVYGLFVARYHDESSDDFSRQEARDLVPKTNPFLFQFFDHIAGASFDHRIKFIVDELCEEFTHADVQAIIHDYYKVEKDSSKDPIIHFYEDFLNEYDPEERKKMGVFYTPLPVVKFITKSIDYILKNGFGLNGIADSSKVNIDMVIQGKKSKQPVHRVQILDPATGTGTFLNEIISVIKSNFKGQEGRWPSYVKNELLPRLHGFEIMMAPYTIAHLKLATKLKESGADINEGRLGVYLTNSLEKSDLHEDNLLTRIGFGMAITEESRKAGEIKNNLPIMVLLGNPPYSGVSSNETVYANSLVSKYKFEPGGKEKLKERKHWLNDDYVKFIAFAEDMINKNSEGVLGFITNHGYLDNPTFRGMRWHLMNTFDSIYVVDLHGNAKKKEVSPDGSKDENIFNIQQGVSIILAIKKTKRRNGVLSKVHRLDIWGSRKSKFDQLNKLSIENAKWTSLKPQLPALSFAITGSKKLEKRYNEGFSIKEIFNQSNIGLMTARDKLFIDYSKTDLESRIVKAFSPERNLDFDEKFRIENTKSYKLLDKLSSATFNKENIIKVGYRPFDIRYCYYDVNILSRPLFTIQKHLFRDNLALLIPRQLAGNEFRHVFISNTVTEMCLISNATKEANQIFPLYLYFEDGSRVVNFQKEIFNKIDSSMKNKIDPENLLDYIYAVLYSPSYREKYKEFLKIDFPRVPYPKNDKQFFALVKLGEELRQIHLLESKKINKYITTFPETGDDTVDKVKFEKNKVYINDSQYFGGVPEDVWNFYIGGYQPAQKWLKDRKGRTLTNEDIEHYQKMIVAINQTIRIMKEIDKVIKL